MLGKVSLLLVSLVCALILLAGCTSGPATQQQYVCQDGSVVSNPSDCAAQLVENRPQQNTTPPAQQTPPPQQNLTPTPPEPERDPLLEDKCVSVLQSQINNTNLTASESDCYSDIYFYPASRGQADYEECAEIIFSKYRALCQGFYAGFVDDKTKCSEYDGISKDSCIVGYASGIIDNHEEEISANLCDGIVNETLMEGCLGLISPYLPCRNNDDFCPTKCSYLTDNNCPKYSLGQKAITEDGMEITVSGPVRNEHCYTNYDSEYLDDQDYGYYYVVSAAAKNSGTQAELVSYLNFILVDSRGTQHEADGYIIGDSCEDASPFEQKNLYPGSSESGELWFELGDQRTLPSGEIKIVYDPNTFSDGDEIVFVVD